MTEAFSLISGPDPSAATGRALAWAAESAGDHPDAVLCLTQSGERADELARRWRTDHDPIRLAATTLDRYVGELYERATASLAGSTPGNPDRLRLVEAAIERHGADDGPFAGVRHPSNELVDQVQGLFSLLEYAGYATPAAIELALHCAGTTGDDAVDPDLYGSFRDDDVPTRDGPLATQADTVAELYAEYERLRDELHPPWTAETPERYLRLLDGDLLVAALPDAVDAVVLDGLTRLAPVERAAVARIARSRPAVAVVPLVHDSMGGIGLDRGVERALLVFQAIGFGLDYRIPPSVDRDRLAAVRRLHTPSSSSLSTPSRGGPSLQPADVGVEWIEPPTEREEVRTAGRRVGALLARDDVAPSDVGIVVTDRTTYRGVLSETLARYDVPFTFTNDVGIEQTLVGDAVEALLDLAADDPRASSLHSLCSNALVSPGSFGIDASAVGTARDESSGDSLEEVLEALEDADAPPPADATAAPPASAEGATSAADAASTAAPTSTADGVRRLVEAVAPADDSLGAYATALRETLASLGIESAVDWYGSPDEATGSHRPAHESAAWESVEDVLSSLERIAPHVDGDDPAGRVRRALRAELVGGPDQREGYVRVLPLTEAEAASFEHLFVLGLTSGYFPGEQDTMAFFGAINDADEEFARAHTGRRARYILGTLLTGSGDVVLSTPRHTVDGTEHVPAPLIAELREHLDGPDDADEPAGAEPLRPAAETGQSPLVSPEDVQRAYAAWAGSQQFDSPDRAVDALDATGGLSSDARAFAARGLRTAWRRSRPELTPHDAQVEGVLDDVFPVRRRGPYSPSALEDYARCPFVFLCKRVLGFEEDYGDEDDVGRADRGTYVHDVLADFHRELREADHVPVDLGRFDRTTLEDAMLDAALDRLDALGAVETPFARRTVARLLAGLGSPADNPYYGSRGGDDVAGLFARFLDEELDAHETARARPTYLEAGIGIDDEDVERLREGAVSVDTPRGGVEVHGIADRVDVVAGIADQAAGIADQAAGIADRVDDVARDARGIHVRDYKTGSTPARKDVTRGTKLQLPVYGLALETVLEDATGASHETLGGSYYGLESPDDVDPHAAMVSSREAVDDAEGLPMLPPPSQPWRLPFDSREEFRRLVRDVTPARLGRIATGIERGAFHPTLLSADLADCEDCSFRHACDVRHHHRQGTIAGLDETRHYVSERAREEELDLDAYAAGGED